MLSFGFLMPLGDVSANTSLAPSFEKHFAKPLTSDEADSEGRVERVFNVSCVSQGKSLQENVECLFFPGEKGGGVLWGILRYVGMILVFVYIVYAAITLILNAKKPDEMKAAMNNLLYILIGSALFF